ncbi:hypothetical protein D3C86_1067110 [compost metagenome]
MVIITTPLAALEPYIAVADASFRISMLSISFIFNPPKLLSPLANEPAIVPFGESLPLRSVGLTISAAAC